MYNWTYIGTLDTSPKSVLRVDTTDNPTLIRAIFRIEGTSTEYVYATLLRVGLSWIVETALDYNTNIQRVNIEGDGTHYYLTFSLAASTASIYGVILEGEATWNYDASTSMSATMEGIVRQYNPSSHAIHWKYYGIIDLSSTPNLEIIHDASSNRRLHIRNNLNVDGNVTIGGNLSVGGTKAALVRSSNGGIIPAYANETPRESWVTYFDTVSLTARESFTYRIPEKFLNSIIKNTLKVIGSRVAVTKDLDGGVLIFAGPDEDMEVDFLMAGRRFDTYNDKLEDINGKDLGEA